MFTELNRTSQSLFEHFGALLMKNSMRESDVTDDCLMLYLLNNHEGELLAQERVEVATDFGKRALTLYQLY